jgi:glycosyltransferase involved in cell wall biosynthesis
VPHPNDVVVVIPCLNEAGTIAKLVADVQRHIPSVLVVDDGSTDATAARAAEAGAEIISHPTPLGKGAALASGFKCARERGLAWALAMDGDGQHAPDDIPKFLEARVDVPLVIGNRMGSAGEMPWVRRGVNRWMSRRISKLMQRDLPDTQCGFRLVQLAAWSALLIEAAHFEIESEMLVAFLAAGSEVAFVPIRVIYRNERSKIHPLRDTVRWFRWWRGVRRRISASNRGSRAALYRAAD